MPVRVLFYDLAATDAGEITEAGEILIFGLNFNL